MILVDDATIAALNRTYLGVAGPTDVLAFPMGKAPSGLPWLALLGDVVISVETARRQARGAGSGLRAELALLLVHGILHLVGYDHQTPPERRRMWRRQREILSACGIPGAARRRAMRAAGTARSRAAGVAPAGRG